MEISTKAWKSRQKHGNLDKSMEISTKAWRSRQKHGDLDKSMEISTTAGVRRMALFRRPPRASTHFDDDKASLPTH
jgi:hypothetical protein